jgi:ribosome maturation factor RimP
MTLAAVDALCQKVSAAQGVELYHVEFNGRVLRVLIESVGGASLDACSRFSRELSSELDVAGIIPGRYLLEVSSPGVERRLYRPADFERAVGSKVRISTKDGAREARLQAADAHAVTLVWTDRNQPGTAIIRYQDVTDARLVVSDQELFAARRPAAAPDMPRCCPEERER